MLFFLEIEPYLEAAFLDLENCSSGEHKNDHIQTIFF